MSDQKVRDASLACQYCNGYGYVVQADVPSRRELADASIYELARPVRSHHKECWACAGTGRNNPRPPRRR